MIELAGLWQQVVVHLWQTTWILLVILGIARLGARSSAQALHAIYALALVKILVPNSVLASLLPRMPEGATWFNAGHTLAPIYTLSPYVEPAHFERAGALAWIVSVVWILGLGYRLRLLRRHAKIARSLLCETIHAKDERLLSVCREMRIPLEAVRIGCGGDGRLTGPITVGLLRPKIVLPPGALRSYTTEELRAVLAHEERHWRRRDPLWMFVGGLLEALLFFYPPVSHVLRRLDETNELLCDRAALTRGIAPESYLSALSVSVRSALHSRPVLFAEIRSSLSFHSRWDRIRHPWRYQSMMRATGVLFAALSSVATGAFLTQSFETSPIGAANAEVMEAPFDIPPVLDDEYGVAISYPEGEREENVSGTVMVTIDIAADGSVSDAAIQQGIEGYPAFEEQVLRIVKQWHFIPAEKNDQPVASRVLLPVKFSLC